mmetsp:Transcript_30358/g.47128  ORF Transcript_30358/g.47128 Transcript_30358/m.47128 type:complete len:274 (-) Transcript_30358:18-839(-)|eukprot:CAMPEP_0201525400 /NCGR_PEP_ID=MMETSP0161_2-20130828/28094_1 /ASSEMBLY_ACC=CAM_ASM_000251 /TAXON_ID=180227 /ORGANISM="Neoparamoeba aestuarina, Strain SoJaBio B1-5/56/2" /LENGTH=273 /DNA_ID=CAMNT_0047925301 /DNA_START=66 /DNA_END=887 /DNA_ORIENTATION=-
MASRPIVKEGWLFKEGGKRKNWKKRRFVLQGESDKDTTDSNTPPVYFFFRGDGLDRPPAEVVVPKGSGIWHGLQHSTIQKEDNYKKKNFVFSVKSRAFNSHTHRSGEERIFYIQAESSEERDEWVKLLLNAKQICEEKEKLREEKRHAAEYIRRAVIKNENEEVERLMKLAGKSDLDKIFQEPIDCRGLLHYAVLNYNFEAVKMLVERGAQVNLQTSKYESGIKSEGGWTPLDLAVNGGNKEIIEYLRAHGAEQARTKLGTCSFPGGLGTIPE